MQHLPTNTLLQDGKYKIERVLGQGGFGITYLATQELFDRHVCIKEFFFKDYCERGAQGEVTSCTTNSKELVDRFLNKFIKEARTISRLDHPNIVRILDIFQENGTAYYAMEYIEGCSLADKVNKQGVLSEAVAVDYIKQVASALDYIHQRSINHLDVKPANIMVRQSDNKAILIDFGLSKQYDEQGGQTSTTPVGISHGYAPMEQYNQGGVSTFSPQTDIYSLGATLYKLVTSNTPPQAIEVFNEGLTGLPQSLSSNLVAAIKKTMQPKRGDRPQSISEFTALLGGQFTAMPNSSISSSNSDESTRIIGTTNSKPAKNISSPQSKIAKIEEVREKKGKNGMIEFGVIIGIVVVCFVTLFLSGIGNSDNKNNYSYTTSAPQQSTMAEISRPSPQPQEQIHQSQSSSSSATTTVTTGKINGHEWVDLGLSVKWATCNVGASSPSDFGGYYAWGESDIKEFYGEDNYSWKDKSKAQLINIGVINKEGNLLPVYDVATRKWGTSWRMPTLLELRELRDLCTWNWKNHNGNSGFEIIGPNGKSIFLPASGFKGNYAQKGMNSHGNYWSSTMQEYLYIDDNGEDWRNDREYPGNGYSVRPVSTK